MLFAIFEYFFGSTILEIAWNIFLTYNCITFFWSAFKWCRRRGGVVEESTAKEAVAARVVVIPSSSIDAMQPRKCLLSAYALWAVTGIFGAHHFYLGRVVHGLLATWTLNFFGLGWIMDFFLLPVYVCNFNSVGVAPMAPCDKSRGRLFFRLPLTAIVAVGLPTVLLIKGPVIMNYFGVLDIDRIAAQTAVNPYELLGLGRGASMSEAKAAYRKESLRWHPDRNANCGKECEDKMGEISKAFELIKKRQAPLPEDSTWDNWLKNLFKDWKAVIEAVFDNGDQR